MLAACSEPYDPVAPPSQAASAAQANAPAKGDRVATVELTPVSASMVIGDTTMFTATPRDAKGNALTGRVVTWAISDTTIAIVSPTGVVRALAAGSASVTATADGKAGSAALTVTAGTPTGTRILPGQSIQAAVDANPVGTAFVIAAGVHRLQQVVPKSGNTFTGEPGAVMSGAQLLTAFTREGSYWVAGGQTQEGAVAGQCSRNAPRCNRPEQLFIDDVLLTHVATLSGVAAGKWYFDYAADKIYFADDPTGRRVETSVTPFAVVDGGGNGVTIKNLVIEKYATPGDQATVLGVSSTDWVLEGNELRWNQGIALAARTRWRVVRNNVHHNGEVGISVGGTANDGTVIESNQVAYNNTAGYDKYWQAGGMKLLRTKNLRVRDNDVHHNAGYGVWTDYNNDAVLIEGNRVTDNAMAGIYHEVSASAVIRNNVAERNGTSAGTSSTDAAGIVVDNSHDVEIYGNTVTDNRGGGIILRQVNRTDLPAAGGAYGPYELHDVSVHDNTVTMHSGTTGVVQYVNNPAYWTSRNNRFAANRYLLGTAAGYFAWQGGTALSESQWKAAGQDVTGTFTR